jgi:hypothetical protein
METTCPNCGCNHSIDPEKLVFGAYALQVREFCKVPVDQLDRLNLHVQGVALMASHSLGVETEQGKERLRQVEARLKELPVEGKTGDGSHWIVEQRLEYKDCRTVQANGSSQPMV